MKNLWSTISNLGTISSEYDTEQDTKRLVFFNQVLFVGIFATVFQIFFVWPFLGYKSLLFLIICATLILCLYLNSIGKFQVSKWFYVLVVYGMGTYTTTLLGGAFLYHIQAILIFTSCLIMFDLRKEKLHILIGIPFLVASITIGELGLFGAPDFSDHIWTPIARIANIYSLLIVHTILISFIIRLNARNEKALEEGKDELEELVWKRTSELEHQKSALIKQNEDKEVLLKEVHHRVRNNLQIIVSLVNLQLAKTISKSTENALKEIQGRVESMSLVHQKMYQTSDFKKIDLMDYTDHIVANISQLYGRQDFKAKLNIPEGFSLQMERAIPFGLVINEIVSNYFKHADQKSGKNVFTLDIDQMEGGFRMHYKDFGSGFPEGLNLEEIESLGMTLIANLVDQLEGSCKYYNDNGAVIDIHIPIKDQQL